ncbi:MAG TPA: hypothetical protein QGF58_19195 [Myxococcota bacterium]|nr:hypothetical protein [Myxococcota bacterium]
MLLLLFMACPPPSDADPDDSTVVTDDSTGETDDSTDYVACDPKTDSVSTVGIFGVVLTDEGDPVQCLRAQFCNSACTVGDNNADGEYSVVSDEAGTGAFEIFPLTDDYSEYFVAHTFWDNAPGTDTNLDIVLQKVDGGWKEMPASATPTEMGEGLTVALGSDLLSLPFGTDVDTVGAAVMSSGERLPLADFPSSGEIVLAYTLSPFDGHASSGMAWSIDHSSIEDGTTYEIWQMELDTTAVVYEWGSLGTATASGTTLEGDGLTYLTTLIVVEP